MPLAGQLTQDYARCARANQPVQRAAPILPIPIHRLPDADHELQLIEGLWQHILDSLTEIPDDLPELKGLCAKLPRSYEGEDDFDHLDNWLQGLLRYFKLHCLTGADRDVDWVLVTGTCLTGKAECYRPLVCIPYLWLV
jgi:hypothetical protein